MADNVTLNASEGYDPPPDDREGRSPERNGGETFASEVASIQVARFSPLGPGAPPAPEPASLDLLLDVPLRITVELGRAHMAVRDVLALQTGSVVELDRAAGHHGEARAPARLSAHGEVVELEARCGVRITAIVSPPKPASAT